MLNIKKSSLSYLSNRPLYWIRLKRGHSYFWHIIAVDKQKEPLLVNTKSSNSLDISNLGTILESDWGVDIPQSIKEKYGFE